jgi:hypothetical protein
MYFGRQKKIYGDPREIWELIDFIEPKNCCDHHIYPFMHARAQKEMDMLKTAVEADMQLDPQPGVSENVLLNIRTFCESFAS